VHYVQLQNKAKHQFLKEGLINLLWWSCQHVAIAMTVLQLQLAAGPVTHLVHRWTFHRCTSLKHQFLYFGLLLTSQERENLSTSWD